ncbi:MAG: hypothetical protein HY736_13980 [Verrucomicrobia bacterium]|nr:hypothetical protein [Verrucomicrobiota bacterium]
MPRLRFPSILGAVSALMALDGAVFAATAPDPRTVSMREQVLRMTEFFDTTLPGTVGKRNMTLHFTPKFSDFRHREYVRYPFEVRYGIGERWDLSGGIMPFGPNPFKSGQDNRWGPGEVKLGLRYDLGALLNFFDATTVGFETRIPVGKPPTPLNDHYTHVKPFASAAHTLGIWPDTTFYANLSYDRSVELSHRGEPPPDVMRRNTIEVVPGLLFKPGQFGYFAEYRFRHIAEETDSHLAHEVRLGSIWDVPLARSEKWRLPGKWQLELAYKVSAEQGQDLVHGVATRVSWRTTLREIFSGTNGNTAKTSR